LEFNQQNLDNLYKIEDRVRQQKLDFFNLVSTLETSAQKKLSTILDTLKNTNPDTLDLSTRTQIQTLANKAGIPFNVLIQGLETQYNQNEFDNLLALQKASTTTASSDLVNAIMANPQLYYSLSATARNSVLPQLQAMGFDVNQLVPSTFAKASADAQSSFNTATSMLDTIQTLALNAIKATNTLGAAGEYISLNAQALNPNTAAGKYKNTLTAFLSMLARASGEKGVLTSEDLERIKNAMPKFGMTRDTVTTQIKTVGDLLNSIKSGAVEAYGGTTISDNLSDDEAYQEYLKKIK
jgi:hypothetical protein